MGIIDEIVERRISEARRNGELDGLVGHGKPLADLDQTRQEGWWARRLVKTELPEIARNPELYQSRGR